MVERKMVTGVGIWFGYWWVYGVVSCGQQGMTWLHFFPVRVD